MVAITKGSTVIRRLWQNICVWKLRYFPLGHGLSKQPAHRWQCATQSTRRTWNWHGRWTGLDSVWQWDRCRCRVEGADLTATTMPIADAPALYDHRRALHQSVSTTMAKIICTHPRWIRDVMRCVWSRDTVDLSQQLRLIRSRLGAALRPTLATAAGEQLLNGTSAEDDVRLH